MNGSDFENVAPLIPFVRVIFEPQYGSAVLKPCSMNFYLICATFRTTHSFLIWQKNYPKIFLKKK